MRQIFVLDEETQDEFSAVEFYFVREDGSTFKAAKIYSPYFLLKIKPTLSMAELEEWLVRRYEGRVYGVEVVHKEDLDLLNHLSGIKQPYVKLSFRNTQDLMAVRREVAAAVAANARLAQSGAAYQAGDLTAADADVTGVSITGVATEGALGAELMAEASPTSAALASASGSNQLNRKESAFSSSNIVAKRGDVRKRFDRVKDAFLDIREYDVPFTQRVQIDLGLRVGLWYDVTPQPGSISCDIKERPDLLGRPQMRILAYDIETSKAPLKFPNAEIDPIMMISLMVDGQGLLIVNREIVSEDIQPFDYTPKSEYPGPFDVVNCPSEEATIRAFIECVRRSRPIIIVTYNGDFFDWPYVDKRARKYGISLEEQMGITFDENGEECRGRYMVHLDAFYWVKRDSYLPQGSHGLKAVTKAKLKYDPVELDPEDMLPFAIEKPQVLASYSVSDAVATYYLYLKYVHSFIFSLCVIIPLPPSDVLRKGSGTLCELLLMVKAYESNVVCPNKQMEDHLKFYKGHLLESETYIGAHVECLESGVFRADIPVDFHVNPKRCQALIDDVDTVLQFCIVEENQTDLSAVVNYNEVRADIVSKLEALRDQPNIKVEPLIYHLDVGAMYPNIILTNRLQPYATVTPSICAACDFNVPESQCQRRLKWSWRGKYYVASAADFQGVKTTLEYAPLSRADIAKFNVETFSELTQEEQAKRIKDRLKIYCRKIYKRLTEERIEEREAVICQREHPFYVDTVRSFRDRRYEYKALNKKWGRLLSEAKDEIEKARCKDMILLYDSMQLAHKCILNSFYGYVMRKGARWHSMEMAGVVTQTGAKLIQEAQKLVNDVGRVLELDTDGIWCVLPRSFPENYTFEAIDAKGNKKKIHMSYPCSILNAGVNGNFANPQYQTLVNPETREYKVSRECTIYFEVDGPYRAMVLPASQHEGKNIKKRYAVFHKDGSLAELKGFEIKRRGELKLIKIFQGEVFKTFLDGNNLQECYAAVGAVADRWLDVLYTQGRDLEDEDVFDLISENKSMTEELAAYGDAKSTSITTAQRLGEFLGAEMVKDKGLNCKFVIARLPLGAPVSERAIPVAIFSAEPAIQRHFLRKWLKDPSLTDFDIRNLLDWDYYIGRLGSAIQKIITIPAAFQRVDNPVPRVLHPDWLERALRERNDKTKQVKLGDLFRQQKPEQNQSSEVSFDTVEIEELISGKRQSTSPLKKVGRVVKFKGSNLDENDDEGSESDAEDESGARRRAHADPEGNDDQFEGIQLSADPFSNKGASPFSDHDSTGHASSSSSKQKASAAKAQSQALKEAMELLSSTPEPPSSSEDFKGWVRWQRASWLVERHKRREQNAKIFGREVVAKSSVIATASSTSLPLTKAVQPHASTNTYWQIVQVLPHQTTPGLFDMWVIVNGSLRQASIEVPRVFYLNTHRPNTEGERAGRKVERILPHGRPCLNLYEMTMSESEFVESRQGLLEFSRHPDVEGLYETRTPLLLTLISKVGCVASPTADALKASRNRSKGAGAGAGAGGNVFGQQRLDLHIDNMIMRNARDCPYLAESDKIQRVFVYHANCDSRHILAVTVQGSTNIQIIAVSPANVERVNLKALHQQLKAQFERDENVDDSLRLSGLASMEDTLAVAGQTTVPTFGAAAVALREILLSHKASSSNPTIVLLQTTMQAERFVRAVPVLRSDFPLVVLPSHDADEQFPALQWFTEACRRLLIRVTLAEAWWDQHVAVAASAGVPIGNLTEDPHLFALDVRFSRVLRDAGHLSWASPSPAPDLGSGASEHDDETDLFSEEHVNPEITARGCYRSVCYEIDLRLLPTAALVSFGHLETAEDAGVGSVDAALQQQQQQQQQNKSAMTNEIELRTIRETLSNSRAVVITLKVLQTLALRLVTEVRNTGNISLSHAAGDALICLYRWLKNPAANLHDPTLFSALHKVMKKVFLQLVSTLRKLGCSIIYASFSKLIISTNKPTHARAEAFLKYILESIRARPLFSLVRLEPTQMWYSLLFYDAANFAGIAMSPKPELPEHVQLAVDPGDPDLNEPRIECAWNIADFLPDSAREIFEITVSEFLTAPYAHVFRASKRGTTAESSEAAKAVLTAQDRENTYRSYIVSLVTQDLQRKLLRVVSELQAEFPPAPEGQVSPFFPVMPGSHLPLRSVPLEFVKSLMHVLMLDPLCQDEVMRVKSNLLLKLNVQTFSPEARFINPCLTFTVPDVVCSYCQLTSDVDLCRDPGQYFSPTLGLTAWRCVRCQHTFSRWAIESSLIRIAKRKMQQYQVQDLFCVKCHGMKVTNITDTCTCSGLFANSEAPDAHRHKLEVLLNIAKSHKFLYLAEILEWYLQA